MFKVNNNIFQALLFLSFFSFTSSKYNPERTISSAISISTLLHYQNLYYLVIALKYICGTKSHRSSVWLQSRALKIVA